MSIQTVEPLRHLPPEPWGRKMRRAREDVAGLSLAAAAELVSPYLFTSGSNISRMEQLDGVPSGAQSRSRRHLAVVLVLAYGMDPAEFGLDLDDLPTGVQVPARTPNNLVEASTIWYAAAA